MNILNQEFHQEDFDEENHQQQMKLDPEHLLYSALSLLNYDFQEQSKLLNIKIGPGTFDADCPKAFYNILKFLICKLVTDSSETVDLLLFYPPRNPKDTINFKQEAYKLLQTLQKRHILPQSLFLSKIVLDEVKGLKCVQFLRFLAEFALKNEFIQTFPQSQMKVFNINLRNDKKTDHQLHLVDELYPTISILNTQKEQMYSLEEIQEQNSILRSHLEIEYDKIQKKMMNYSGNTQEVQVLAEKINKSYQKQREINLRLKDYLVNEHDVPEKLLSDLRKLDRMPQIDLIKQTISELQEIERGISDRNFKERYQQFLSEFLQVDQTNVINKSLIHAGDQEMDPLQQNLGLIKLENYFESYKNTLKNTDKNIQNLKTEQFLTYQSSLLDKLQGIKQRQSKLTKCLIELKQNCQEEL
ncbi:hypothetical protein TTHERM_00024300 (macronuclear) [Tetrahymena thermophila SB210]|uniref:HAUS augmin-like complex subunit 6 N-terminal domain-containing protein n=1 Tax=Tetrahymena thermophila (strain SB210) TaxID=312017 RepID=Q22R51_TETTS|nr:hypothetical protein TTHERM_00024300 [Tetrahymena thermophila SB210]EAR88271.1 hypothetical protein TTHERM_00024300 [Tetrahymena thermophila SB210]|eukprot:XP_001008516.1 hypothetical protein TTHERM_00024300 [Tetrahymena thermophila SB210]